MQRDAESEPIRPTRKVTVPDERPIQPMRPVNVPTSTSARANRRHENLTYLVSGCLMGISLFLTIQWWPSVGLTPVVVAVALIVTASIVIAGFRRRSGD